MQGMKIAITGASGFIGRQVTIALAKEGHEVRSLSLRGPLAADALGGVNAVVHLAGEPIAQRWSADARKRIMESRVDGTRKLIDAMRAHRPQVLVSASGVGYYGSQGDTILTESSPAGNDFPAQVCAAWEAEAEKAADAGTRVVRLRFGMVLGPDGGALEKMLPPFRLGAGGPIAGGGHWMPWIHMHDATALVSFMLKESTVRGVFNASSPHPVTNAEFTNALATALHRPAFLPIPGFALKLLYGDMAELVLASQRVMPKATLAQGFTFRYPDIHAALLQILS
jgi:uncharacterized protein (TIGR01777 family)